MVAAHNNGIKDDNRLENLRWATHKENSADAKKHGTLKKKFGETNGRSRVTADVVKRIRADKRPICVIAREVGLCWSAVSNIRKGRSWKHLA
jgi:hypothetical protein